MAATQQHVDMSKNPAQVQTEDNLSDFDSGMAFSAIQV